MAKSTGQEQSSNSLEGFDFEDSTSFFGIKNESDESQTSKTIKEVTSTATDAEGKRVETTKLPARTEKSKKREASEVDENDPFKDDEEEDEGTTTFFGITEEEDLEVKPKEKDKPKVKGKVTKEVTTEVDDDDAEVTVKGSKIDDKDDVEDDNEEDDDKEDDDKFFPTLAKELNEKKGFFVATTIKAEDIKTEEQFFESIEDEVEARLEESFEAFGKNMDDDGKSFLKFKRNGGSTMEFLKSFAPTIGIDKFDEKNETHRQLVINKYLTLIEQLDEDEVLDRVTYIKESGKEEMLSIKYYNKIKEIDDKRKAQALQIQADRVKAREEDAKKFQDDLREVAATVDKVGAFTFTKQETKELMDFIIKPTVKVDKAKFIPEFQKKLTEILTAKDENTKKQFLLLAKLLKNNFDIKEVIADKTTEVVKGVRSRLKDAKENVKTRSTSSNGRKQLADYFDQ